MTQARPIAQFARLILLLVAGGLASAEAAPGESGESGADLYPDRPRTCEGCHERAQDDAVEFEDGGSVSAHVDPVVHANSIHGPDGADMVCTDCHRRIRSYPHLEVRYANEAEFRARMSATCNRCHFPSFTAYRQSEHFVKRSETQSEATIQELWERVEAAPESDPEAEARLEDLVVQTSSNAPVCVDCHGGHDVQAVDGPRRELTQSCNGCHEDVAATYADSVHGRSHEEGIEDVPVCLDCHGSHAIAAPKTRSFHVGSYQICAECHGDREMMAEYGLTANVLDTYLDDFHGSSNFLYLKVGHIPADPVATCGDCHGVHDVQHFDREQGEDAARARVSEMCAECHEGATESFADAWMSHSAPTFAKTPIVWMVMWGYRILIPFMVLGLVIHISMHIFRAIKGSPGEGEAS